MWSILRQRDFRLLWLSQSASVIGDALVVVAIGLFVTRRTGHVADVGLVLSAYAVPFTLCLLIGGVIADRLPRRRIIIATDVVRGSLHALLAVLIATGVVHIWHMVIIGGCYGAAEAFFRPAYMGLIPQAVAEADISRAQALTGISNEVAMFASPALATALLLGFGGSVVFALDAATFALSAALLSRLTVRQRGEPAHDDGSALWHDQRAGSQAVRERDWVWATIAGFSCALLLALAPFFVLGARIAHDEYGSSAVYGWASAAWGAGTVTGVVIGARWQPHHPIRAGLLLAVPWPAALAVYALGVPVGIAYLAIAASGFGIGAFQVWWETALAERIPPHLLSRVSAWDWMGSLALLPLGYAVAGPLADHVGARPVLIVGGTLGTLAMLTALLPRQTRTLRRLGVPSAVPPGPDVLEDRIRTAVAGQR